MFEVLHTRMFDKCLRKLPEELREWIDKVEGQLTSNPYVGDQLQAPWLREKKLGKFRVYYLIYDELSIVYLVAISEKKDQQRVINSIFYALDRYREEITRMKKMGNL